jgi:hypothetical protein
MTDYTILAKQVQVFSGFRSVSVSSSRHPETFPFRVYEIPAKAGVTLHRQTPMEWNCDTILNWKGRWGLLSAKGHFNSEEEGSTIP